MVIGIFGGSFNPIHVGHIALAQAVLEQCGLDEVWLMVSPQNPLKQEADLLDDHLRLALTQKALEGVEGVRACDYEFCLPTPSYTINTLTALSEQYPDCEFVFICGMDSLQNLKNWREYQKILDNYELLVFPREGYDGGELANYPSVNILKTPVLEISSTFIRHSIKEGRDVRHFVPEKVFQYIQEHHFYE